jgi:hypothetical protein
MTTARVLSNLIKDLPIDAKVYFQAGYNRFEIDTFTVDKNGDITFILNEEANNPKIVLVESPKELA